MPMLVSVVVAYTSKRFTRRADIQQNESIHATHVLADAGQVWRISSSNAHALVHGAAVDNTDKLSKGVALFRSSPCCLDVLYTDTPSQEHDTRRALCLSLTRTPHR